MTDIVHGDVGSRISKNFNVCTGDGGGCATHAGARLQHDIFDAIQLRRSDIEGNTGVVSDVQGVVTCAAHCRGAYKVGFGAEEGIIEQSAGDGGTRRSEDEAVDEVLRYQLTDTRHLNTQVVGIQGTVTVHVHPQALRVPLEHCGDHAATHQGTLCQSEVSTITRKGLQQQEAHVQLVVNQ